jgi:DNA-binding GntR family transcriptional regulator
MNIPNVDTSKLKHVSTPSQSNGDALSEMPRSEQQEQVLDSETHRSICARIRETVLRRISNGTYKPGERLKELTLAHEFEVSQAPVREAFKSLESLGVLVSEHYRGTRVRAVTDQETEEVYQLRGYLEEIAARLIPAISLKENIVAIEALQTAMRTAALTGDIEGFAQANVQFHRTIVSLAPNHALLKVWDSLEIAMRSRMNLHRNEKGLPLLAEIHQPIVDALKRGDLQRAGVLLKEHCSTLSDVTIFYQSLTLFTEKKSTRSLALPL